MFRTVQHEAYKKCSEYETDLGEAAGRQRSRHCAVATIGGDRRPSQGGRHGGTN